MKFVTELAMSFSLLCITSAHTGRYVFRRVFQQQKEVHGVRLIIVRNNRIVLVRHWYAPGVWTLPGGGVEPYESVEDAAKREAREETGYDILSFAGELGTYEGMTKHDTVQVLIAGEYEGGLKVVPDREIMQRGLFDLDKLPENLSPANRRRIEAYIKGVRGERGKW